MKAFKTDFEGTGAMKEFVAEVVKALELLNNIKIIAGPNYTGDNIEFGVTQKGRSLALELKINNLTNRESR